MKRLFSLLALLLLAVLAPLRTQAAGGPSSSDDTIMVKLPNQATMTLYVKNKEQLRDFRAYHLDSLMRMLDAYVNQAVDAGTRSKTDQVTLEFKPGKDHPGAQAEVIRVTVRSDEATANAPATAKADRVDVVMGKVFGVTVVESNTDKGSNVSVHIGSTPAEDSIRNAERKARREEHANRAVHSSFSLDLGLNAIANRQPFADATGELQSYDLRPLASRYVSLNWHYDVRLGGKGSPLYLVTGPELAFNNYMFEGNRRVYATDTRTDILNDNLLELQKSKLSVTTGNLPLMLQLKVRDKEGHSTFTLGGGGYVGYRLGSHTKLKYDDEGRTRKDKDRGSFNLEDFQYGLQGSIGVRNIDFFVKYALNNLYQAGQGPAGNTVSFGISLME